jgi:hypothetical protein
MPRAARTDILHLLTMFGFFLEQRELGKPIEVLSEAVRDLRLISGRLLLDHFMRLDAARSQQFCKGLATLLADRCDALPSSKASDKAYGAYCVGEILTCFQYAREIKQRFAGDPVMQKMLAVDIPILRPFDYGLRGRLRVVTPQKRYRLHR